MMYLFLFFISPAPAPIAAPAIAPVVNPTDPHFKAAVPEFFQLPVDILLTIHIGVRYHKFFIIKLL